MSLPCADCLADTVTEYYMVHDDTWAAAGMGKLDGFLCIGCLERRLGRQLTAADFTPAEVNNLLSRHYRPRRSSRLIGRLTGQGCLW